MTRFASVAAFLWPPGLIAAALGLLASTAHAGPVRFRVLDLGTLGGSSSAAAAVNDLGQVVGVSGTVNSTIRAFRTAPNAPITPAIDDLGSLGGDFASAYDINNLGQVVGVSTTSAGGPSRAFRTGPGATINPATDDLGTLGGPSSIAYGINDLGQVVGISGVPDSSIAHAFRTGPNAPINPATDALVTLASGDSSVARDINNRGQVAGAFFTAGAGGQHAFRTSPNAPLNPATDDLGTLGGPTSEGWALNDLGQVVGQSDLPDGSFLSGPPFRTSPEAPINPATDALETFGTGLGVALGINDLGQVVGTALLPGDSAHAFLYQGDGLVLDLNDLVPADFQWELTGAVDINNRGQIVANGRSKSGGEDGALQETRAFLLTPSDGGGPVANPIPVPPAVWTGLATFFAAGAAARRLGHITRHG